MTFETHLRPSLIFLPGQRAQAQFSLTIIIETMKFTDNTIDIQAALALNNIGVSLLERGCYRQGMEVLQDGINVMKDLFKSSPDHGVTAVTSASTTSKLQRAHAKVCDAHAKDSSSTEATAIADIQIQTVSYQINGFTDILSHLGVSPSVSSQYYLVRMDIPVESSSYFHSNTPDLESAVLLYNFGMAQLLLGSQVSPHNSNTSMLMTENAHRMLHLASSIIGRRTTSTCLDTLEETALLQMGLLVLHGIIQVLVASHQDIEAATVHARYVNVRGIVGNLQAVMSWYSLLLVAAPAA